MVPGKKSLRPTRRYGHSSMGIYVGGKVDKEAFLKDFGSRLRETRLQQNISLSHLSELIGLSRSALRYYERGLRDPSLYTFFLICLALNVEPNKLLKEGK
jgi:DNA-binding XRE family transcriptional regulator